MASSDFTLTGLQEKFGIKNQMQRLFPPLPPLMPSEFLEKLLATTRRTNGRSESLQRKTWCLKPFMGV
jgi:hypothetical protein